MKKITIKLLFTIILVVFSIARIDALISNNKEVFAFNYGGAGTDRLYAIDFFSDGSYVVVGETRASFGGITIGNSENDKSDGLVAIYDKDNKLLKEFTWNNGDTDNSTYQELFEVKVIDNNSFITCGLSTYDQYCMKYNKNGEQVWQTVKLPSSESAMDKHDVFSIYITDNNKFLVSAGSNFSKIWLINADGTVANTISLNSSYFSYATEIIKYNDKYILSGSKTSSGSTDLFILNSNFELLSIETLDTATSSIIEDVDVVGDKLLVSVNTGACGNDCNNVFNNSSNKGSIALVDSSYKVTKVYPLDEVSSYMDTQVFEDGTIEVVLNCANGNKSVIYYFDKDLNLINKTTYQSTKHFNLFRSAVNPVNKHLYVVGSLDADYKTITINGKEDGIVMSMYQQYIDDSTHNIDPKDGEEEQSGSGEAGSSKEQEEQSTTKQTTKKVKNPKTGIASITIVVLVIVIVSLTIYFRTKKITKFPES